MERMALNLHRLKKFQGAAELSWAVEVRPILREKTLDRPAARLPAADSDGTPNRRSRPEPPKPETRANRAFHRIPAQNRFLFSPCSVITTRRTVSSMLARRVCFKGQ
jgi:hypothetical protein